MKSFKRFTAAIAATLMAASLSIPMASSYTASAASITINGISTEQAHTFEVYQVLTGELDDEEKLNDMKWGTGVATFNGTAVTPGKELTKAQYETIKALTTENVRTLVTGESRLLTFSTTKADVTSINGTATISGLADGYYIVKDVTALGNEDDANSAWIIQVAGTATVDIKNAKPTVEKKIYDNDDGTTSGDNDDWGETADHAINETFQFKLTATIPANPNLAAYDTYKLVFNDNMSAGVTFDGIAEKGVTVNGTPTTAYTTDAVANTAGLEWTLTIEDVKAIAGSDFGTKDLTVEVVYNAHLNENAIASNASIPDGTDNINKNTVYLNYSNNPDSTGEGEGDVGETTPDTVWAFTYEVDNTKYANSEADENILAGAEFNLLNAEGTPITFSLVGEFYIPTADGDATLVSADNTGKFNIKGLDAGTYTLTETKTPDGYNKCADTTVIISAVHNEKADETAAILNLDGSSNMKNDVINKSGSALPSTGGMGTKLFYLGGGAMVAVAGIFLITKKRMGKNAD